MEKRLPYQMNLQSLPTILSAVFFFAWMRVVPLDGLILQLLFGEAGFWDETMASFVMGVHLLGLFICAITVKELHRARQAMLGSILLCLVASVALFTTQYFLWHLSAMAMAFSAGVYAAAWGCFLKERIPGAHRMTAVADVLIGAILVMILIDVLTVNWNIWSGKLLSLVALLMAALMTLRLSSEKSLEDMPQSPHLPPETASVPYLQRTLIRPFVWLCAFIIIITLNAGLMLQVVTPAFHHLTFLTSFYWWLPYIAALLVLRNLHRQTNRAYTLYVALAMMGLSYLLLIRLPANGVSFVLISTLMMGAVGIFDLFWWSLMASFLDYARRPAAILGLGLSSNVLGKLLGNYAGADVIHTATSYGDVSLTAFAVIFVGLAILPLLNLELSRLFKRHIFLIGLAPLREKVESHITGPHSPAGVDSSGSGMKTLVQQEENENLDPLEVLRESYQLTDREVDIILLLQKGYTYRAISDSLGITENTTKFHAKNIYQKLHVSNKMDLLKTVSPIFEVRPGHHEE